MLKDVDAFAVAIAAREAVLLGEPAAIGEGLRVVHLRDPEGNLIELQQWLR